MFNVPGRCLDLARRLSDRYPILAFASMATIAVMFVQIPQTRAEDLAVGDQTTLSDLARPDRFG